MDSPPFFTGGVSPKTCVIFPKKNFVVPAFRRPKKISKKILSKLKNSFKNGFPTLFYGRRVPKKHVYFSKKKKKKKKSVVLASRHLKKISESRKAKKKLKKIVKFEKFLHI